MGEYGGVFGVESEGVMGMNLWGSVSSSLQFLIQNILIQQITVASPGTPDTVLTL